MNRLPAYLRKPRVGRKEDTVYPTANGWELGRSGSRQQPRIVVSCKNLFEKIIAAEEEVGAEKFKELSGYNSSDFLEGTETGTETKSEDKQDETPVDTGSEDQKEPETKSEDKQDETPVDTGSEDQKGIDVAETTSNYVQVDGSEEDQPETTLTTTEKEPVAKKKGGRKKAAKSEEQTEKNGSSENKPE